MDWNIKRKMIKTDQKISLKEQSQILGINRTSIYYKEKPVFSSKEIKIMHKIDEIYTKYPFYGYRRQYLELITEGYGIGEDKVRKFMRVMSLKTFYPKKTSIINKKHKIYPYLLNKSKIKQPNNVWAADITYIRLEAGFCYLVAIIDWFSRYVLSWRLSNSLDVSFCLDALEEALDNNDAPGIFNTDQGAQFTSFDFTSKLISKQIAISMDSVGRWADNIVIERFFRSLKWEDIYLYNYNNMKDVFQGCHQYIEFYNKKRPHSSLANKSPYQVYMYNLN